MQFPVYFVWITRNTSLIHKQYRSCAGNQSKMSYNTTQEVDQIEVLQHHADSPPSPRESHPPPTTLQTNSNPDHPQTSDANLEDQTSRLPFPRLIAAYLCLCLCYFTSYLDSNGVTTALPAIASALNVCSHRRIQQHKAKADVKTSPGPQLRGPEPRICSARRRSSRSMAGYQTLWAGNQYC